MSRQSNARRSRPGPIIAGASALVLVAAAAGIYFSLFSPRETTVILSAPAPTSEFGMPITLDGLLLPAQPGRPITIQAAATPAGPFNTALTVTTDAAGRYTATFNPKAPGNHYVRATVASAGRYRSAQSPATLLATRQRGNASLTVSSTTLRTSDALTLTATVTEKDAPVTFEKSPDGTTWTKTGPASSRPSTTIRGLTGGTWQFRATVAETDTTFAHSTKGIKVLVEDYKAAGAKYLEIVKPMNKAIVNTNSVGARYDRGAASLDELKAAAGAQSATITRAVAAMRAYAGWPRKAAPLIDSFAKHETIEADQFHLASLARTVDDWDTALSDKTAQYAANDEAALIRDALGLPKRDPLPPS